MVNTKKGITVVGVEASNFHRLRIASAKLVPGQGLVRVTGRNGSGKTSLLRSIRAALGGAGEILPQVVHEGAETGTVKLELSNGFIVTRKFTAANPKGYLTVEGPDGGLHKQARLSEWAGPLSFDPLAFFELKPERQREILLSLGGDPELPGKLDALRRARAVKYDERTPWIAKKRQAAQVQKPEGERPVPVDTRGELARMGQLQQQERDRSDLLRTWEREVEMVRRSAELAVERAREVVRESAGEVDRVEAALNRWEQEVAELEGKLARAKEQRQAAQVAQTRALKYAQEAATNLSLVPSREAVAAAVPAPELPDDPAEEMAAVHARIEAADSVRGAIAPWDAWDRARAEHAEATQAVEAITAEMDGLDAQEPALIASAGIPVEGLGFAPDSTPVLNGRSLAVASGAERIQLAVAVALAADPELRICLVDEANDIDLEGMEELDRLAKEHGFQIWAARLGIEGPGEIVVEDGEAHSRDEPAEEPAGV